MSRCYRRCQVCPKNIPRATRLHHRQGKHLGPKTAEPQDTQRGEEWTEIRKRMHSSAFRVMDFIARSSSDNEPGAALLADITDGVISGLEVGPYRSACSSFLWPGRAGWPSRTTSPPPPSAPWRERRLIRDGKGHAFDLCSLRLRWSLTEGRACNCWSRSVRKDHRIKCLPAHCLVPIQISCLKLRGGGVSPPPPGPTSGPADVWPCGVTRLNVCIITSLEKTRGKFSGTNI